MKLHRALFLLVGGFLCAVLPVISVHAQEASNKKKQRSEKMRSTDQAMLDINQIDCFILNDGSFGENPFTGGSGFYFPAGQTALSIIYTSGLWVIGKLGEDIRSAANCYGTEFQPGSILSPGVPDDPLDPKYRVFKYNKGDLIDQSAIDQGCPDSVLGDQMLFCVYNDITDHSDVWGKLPIGIEVQQTAFAFDREGPLGNTVFVKYHVVNKSDQPLEEAYLSMFFDPDLGYSSDDYTGCDTTLGMGYVYNGDDDDENYGAIVPAMGCDLLQGPIVDAPGEIALLPDGTVLVDKKILSMTAYYTYVGASSIPGMTDPQTTVEGYHFCSGFLGNGVEWIDPTAGNTPTHFPFAGDPVTGTGWLFSSFSSPRDIRFGVSSGPVSIAAGESQDLVLGLVVGQGSDHLGSILAMRYNDQAVKSAYAMNFDPGAPPPAPVVQVGQLDRELVLYWDNTAVNFKKGGYAFEGYNIYQGESDAGPWTRITTFDIINGVTQIQDFLYNEATDEIVEQTVQIGSDSGLSFTFFVEKDYLNDDVLRNGTPYFFAVTSYSHNPEGTPHALENDKESVIAVPQEPVLDVEYNSETGDSISVQHDGPGQGMVRVTIIDPSVLLGDDYEVTFYVEEDSNNNHYGETGWKWYNVSTGELLLQGFSGSEFETVTREGLQIRIQEPSPGILAFIQIANPTYPEPLPDAQLDDAGRYYGGNNIWLSPSCPDDSNHSGRYLWSYYDTPFIGDVSRACDYEIRWKDGIADYSWGVWGFEDNNFDKVPFELWDIGLATPSDNSDDERMIPVLYSDGSTTVWDVPSGSMAETNWGYACSDCIYFTYPDSGFTYDDFHAAAEAGDFTTANLLWGDHPHPFQNLVVVNYTHQNTGPAPAAGTVDRILTNKPNTSDDVFYFSTAEYAPTRSEAVARERLDDINVFPNPYLTYNILEQYYGGQFVTFNNLPAECIIRVFSLSGHLVRTLVHDNGSPFERWDLRNESRKRVASGMYIIHVHTEFGDRILKLAFIDGEAE